MASKKIKAKKVEAIEIEVVDPIIVEVTEEESIKVELNKIQAKLNGGYDTKYRSSLLERQQTLQIKLKSL
tara:strand:- start:420 stop:629 length:210 start_codon:yes stop_codon:yes gene_type:complete